jgi:hypothetical protein
MNGRMTSPALGLEEMPGSPSPSNEYFDGSNALAPSGGHAITLRFRITAIDTGSLEALRHARRSLLREEWTLGLDPDEPSLEDAVFSATEILWTVWPVQREWCLRKLQALVARAQRALPEIGKTRSAAPTR